MSPGFGGFEDSVHRVEHMQAQFAVGALWATAPHRLRHVRDADTTAVLSVRVGQWYVVPLRLANSAHTHWTSERIGSGKLTVPSVP